MAHITREQLLKNLETHAAQTDQRYAAAWIKVMKLLDAATLNGQRSICISQEGEFSIDQVTYIKERAVKEGMRWRWGETRGYGDDSAAYIVLEV